MSTEIAERLAEFAVKLRFAEIPPEVVEFTKGLCLKTVAGMLRGSTMPAGAKAAKYTRASAQAPEVGVIGCGFKTSVWNAVLDHALFAHAAELEDDRFGGGTCWDITVLPLIFTLANKLAFSGRQIVAASAAGLEVHTRTCRFYPQGFRGLSGIPGGVGPAATAARALGLNVAQTTAALGLGMSAVAIAYPSFGTDAHYTESAFQCLQGLIAAELAKAGLNSNPDIMAYMSGLLGKESIAPQEFVAKLGTEWLFTGIWIKKYPCCFYQHRHIDAFLELMKQQDLSYEKIDKVRMHIAGVEQMCDRPDPKNVGDLQFSFQHSSAAVMLDRDVNFSHISAEIILDPRYKEARSKVEIIFHPELVSKYAMGTPARVDVRLKDGSEFSRERTNAIGSPGEPLTMEQFKALFLKFTSGILPEKKLKWTADALAKLEELDRRDVEELMDVLVFKGKVRRALKGANSG